MIKTTKLETLVATRYGVDALSCDALVVEWAAGVMAETDGALAAGRAWRKLNARRTRLGRYTATPRWGSPLYAAYFTR